MHVLWPSWSWLSEVPPARNTMPPEPGAENKYWAWYGGRRPTVSPSRHLQASALSPSTVLVSSCLGAADLVNRLVSSQRWWSSLGELFASGCIWRRTILLIPGVLFQSSFVIKDASDMHDTSLQNTRGRDVDLRQDSDADGALLGGTTM